MPTTLRALVLCGCLAAFSVASGGHWAVLQTVAWSRMIVGNAQETRSVREALVRTFDGTHPCELCRKVSAGFARDARGDRQSSSDEKFGKTKLIAVLPVPLRHVFARGAQGPATLVVSSGGRLADTPPVPPPRAA